MDRDEISLEITVLGEEFADNPQPRSACVLLLDVSSSMSGRPIDELNAGLRLFEEEVKKDELASLRTEIAIVTFDSDVNVVQDFVTVDEFTAPTLRTGGTTALGAGLREAVSMVRDRKQVYRDNGVNYYRPSIFLITDGAPTDANWAAAVSDAHAEEHDKGVTLYVIGVEGANFSILQQISPAGRPPLQLQGLKFREFFKWLSSSQVRVSQSNPGDQVALPAVDGWAVLPTST